MKGLTLNTLDIICQQDTVHSTIDNQVVLGVRKKTLVWPPQYPRNPRRTRCKRRVYKICISFNFSTWSYKVAKLITLKHYISI